MRMIQRTLSRGLVLALWLSGCSMVPTSPVAEGQTCADDGRCANGYVCNRTTNACIKDDGSGCPDADNDGVTTCEDDCDDSNPTCTTDCTDADSDGTCATADCNDGEPLCAADCVTDSDSDTILDCLDTCVDTDGDGIGTGTNGNRGCIVSTVIDSNDRDPEACADTDGDTCDDCVSHSFDPASDGVDDDEDGLCDVGDTCVDVDKDGLGNGTLGNSGCVIPDTDSDDDASDACADTDHDTCDDCSVASHWDPSNDGDDNDSDGICNAGDQWDNDQYRCGDSDVDSCDDCSTTGHWAPANDGTDGDGDGFCLNGSSGDCDDQVPTCSKDCATDVDGDGIPDCRDGCLDTDRDDAGLAGGAGNSCTGPDCKDNDDRCSADCAECPPTSLSVGVPVEPVSTCDDVAISIDLDAYTGAAAQLVCEAPDQSIVGPVNVETDAFGAWSDRSSGVLNEVATDYVDPWCGQGARAIVMLTGAARYMQTAAPLDMTGWEKVRLSFAVGYAHEPPTGHNLKVLHCCGAGCSATPEDMIAITIKNAIDGGQDSCRSETVNLSLGAGCAALEIRFAWESNTAEVLVGDMEVLADLTVSTVSEVSAGTYEATATSCHAMSVPTRCYWPDATDPVVSNSGTIEWQ